MASTDKLEQYKVHKVQELKRQYRREEAREILERVSKQVQPILRRRQWTVPLLREFLPRNPNLLGLNKNGGRGKTMEINVRLRYHHSPDSFYPYEDILGTMLHEITHNVRGPHDNQFYAILEELTKECEELMAKGVTGTGIGFDGPSMGRLGAHSWIPTHNPPPEALRAKQMQAAKQRAAQQAVMSSGPQKVGGSLSVGSLRHLPPQQAAAEAAARRQRDDRQCPSAALAAGEICTIDLLDEDSDDEGGPTAVKKGPAGIQNDRGLKARSGKPSTAATTMSGREAMKSTVGPCAQLGIFVGKPVPGFSDSGGCSKNSTVKVSQTAAHDADAGMGGTVRGDISMSQDRAIGAVSAAGTNNGSKAVNDSAAAKVIDLISPVACCSKQASKSQQKNGCSIIVEQCDDEIDVSDTPVPSKRARPALPPRKGPDDSYIDLT